MNIAIKAVAYLQEGMGGRPGSPAPPPPEEKYFENYTD